MRETGTAANCSGTTTRKPWKGKASTTPDSLSSGRCCRASRAPLQTHGWPEHPLGEGSGLLPGASDPQQPSPQHGGEMLPLRHPDTINCWPGSPPMTGSMQANGHARIPAIVSRTWAKRNIRRRLPRFESPYSNRLAFLGQSKSKTTPVPPELTSEGKSGIDRIVPPPAHPPPPFSCQLRHLGSSLPLPAWWPRC